MGQNETTTNELLLRIKEKYKQSGFFDGCQIRRDRRGQ